MDELPPRRSDRPTVDDRTIAAARTGNGPALRRIYELHAPAVHGYARGQGAEDPEAIANEALYRALSRMTDFDGNGDGLRSWIFAIAHNLVIDDRRRQSRRPVGVDLERAPIAMTEGAEDEALTSLEAQRLIELMDQLAPDQRTVLLLRLVADLPIAQVAKIVDKRAGAVKALQRRGLASLRRLADRGVPASGPTTFTSVP